MGKLKQEYTIDQNTYTPEVRRMYELEDRIRKVAEQELAKPEVRQEYYTWSDKLDAELDQLVDDIRKSIGAK